MTTSTRDIIGKALHLHTEEFVETSNRIKATKELLDLTINILRDTDSYDSSTDIISISWIGCIDIDVAFRKLTNFNELHPLLSALEDRGFECLSSIDSHITATRQWRLQHPDLKGYLVIKGVLGEERSCEIIETTVVYTDHEWVCK